MVVLPDPPTAIEDDTLVTSATVIGLKWQDGTSNGGTPIIDYTIMYD